MDLYEELPYLTRRDRELLQEKTQMVAYRAGDIVLKEGERRQAIFSLVEGLCRVERQEMGEAAQLSQLCEGEIFGEISFIEGGTASASIVACDDSQIGVIDGQFVHALLESESGLALRFYRSIAAILAGRLKATSAALLNGQSWG